MSCGSLLACDQCAGAGAAADSCLHCVPPFELQPSGPHSSAGICVLPAEEHFLRNAAIVVGLLLAVLAGGGAVHGFYEARSCIRQRQGRKEGALLEPTEKEAEAGPAEGVDGTDEQLIQLSDEAIWHGLVQWNGSRMKDWSDPRQRPKEYPWHMDVHHKFIIGVGLAMFYNFHALPGAAALLATGATLLTIARSGLGAAVERLEAARREGGPHSAAGAAEQELEDAVRSFAETSCWAIGFVYMSMLILSWLHAVISKWVIRRFDYENSTMEDYTLVLNHLPETMTCEEELKAYLEKVFGIDLVGVSIGYNLAAPDLRDKVYQMNERILIAGDVQDSLGPSARLTRTEDLQLDKDREEFRALVDAGKLRSTGKAYVVFWSKVDQLRTAQTFRGFWVPTEVELSHEDADTLVNALTPLGWSTTPKAAPGAVVGVAEHWPRGWGVLMDKVVIAGEKLYQGTRVKLPEDPGRAFAKGDKVHIERNVQVFQEHSEPPSILWWNLGVRTREVRRRTAKAALGTFLVFVVIAATVYYPYGAYLLSPFSSIGGSPSFTTMQLMGFVLGISNNILGAVMWMQVWNAGFANKRWLDIFVLGFNVLVSYFNTMCNLAFGLWPSLGGFDAVNLRTGSTAGIQKELELADLLHNILVPGWLFAGFFIGLFMGNIWPYLQNYFLVKVVFSWRCLGDQVNKAIALIIPYQPQTDRLTAREAEMIFSPGEVSLSWDYGPLIVTPSVCFVMLFFLSPRAWRIFPAMLSWVALMYLFHRFLILRLKKKQIHVARRLDIVAQYLWGLPLSILAGAWAHWAERLDCSIIRTPWAILVSLVVYWVGLTFIDVREATGSQFEEDRLYIMARERLIYDWFNSNPVNVLKSRYYPEHLSAVSRAHQLYVYGKEYLHLGNFRGQSSPEQLRVTTRLLQQMEEPDGITPGYFEAHLEEEERLDEYQSYAKGLAIAAFYVISFAAVWCSGNAGF